MQNRTEPRTHISSTTSSAVGWAMAIVYAHCATDYVPVSSFVDVVTRDEQGREFTDRFVNVACFIDEDIYGPISYQHECAIHNYRGEIEATVIGPIYVGEARYMELYQDWEADWTQLLKYEMMEAKQ